MSKPFVSSEAVLQKVQKTATGAFSLDFDDTNLKAKLVALRQRFTRDGYASLMEQYDTSGLIEKIRTRRLVTSAVATGAGVIANEYERDGVYTWETEMPIAITITGQSERKTYECLVKQTVKRLPVEDNPAGIATQSLRLTCNTKNQLGEVMRTRSRRILLADVAGHRSASGQRGARSSSQHSNANRLGNSARPHRRLCGITRYADRAAAKRTVAAVP
ncbi:DotI/IcmL family type IV secretion protein [Cupriavidus basilensis]